MKRISPESQKRIRRLMDGNFWSRLVISSEEQIELLQEIGRSNEAAAIPEIVCLLADTSGPVWRATAEALHRLLQTLGPLELASLESWIREVGAHNQDAAIRWQKLLPSRLSRFAETDFAASLCGLASFHTNGYVREAAVDELCKVKDGSELPFLLLRLNDWVPVIRDCASAGVRERLLPENAANFISNLHLVMRLEMRGRADKSLVEMIYALLRRPECRDALQAGMASQDRALRRASFQLAAGANEAGRCLMIRTAFNDPDPATRAWAARRFLPEVPDVELAQVVGSLLKDRFRPVRQEALWALASRLPDIAAEPLRLALLDTSTSVRETAQHFLAKSGFEIGPYYSTVIREGNPKFLPAAIRGLGEVGQKTDAEQIRPFLLAAEPRLRKAAIYALGRLDAETFLPEFLAGLADSHPGVSRESVRACLPKARFLDMDALWTLFQSDSRFYVRKHALMLIQRFGKWERLAPLVIACGDSDSMISELAKAGIRRWISTYNSSFAEPSAVQIRQIRQGLANSAGMLDRHIVMEIGSCLATFQK